VPRSMTTAAILLRRNQMARDSRSLAACGRYLGRRLAARPAEPAEAAGDRFVMTTPPALVDQRGAGFSFEALRGHPVVVTFVSARCTDACPLINSLISQAAASARARHSSMRFVTITLDPAHDSQRDMRKIADTFAADPLRWQLVSGKPTTIERLMQRFGVVTRDGASGRPDAHTTFVYVLDSEGRLVRTLLPSSRLDKTLQEIAPR
jgi:protein SCO1